MGSLPLPIDAATNELICSACGCNRYAKKSNSGSSEVPAKVNDQAAQKQTVLDIRNTGVAMFSWLTDQIGAAGAGQAQTIDLKQYSSISRAELGKILVPQYMQELPEKDGWGHPYEYTLNSANLKGKPVMSIRSPGRDGAYSASNGVYTTGRFDPTDFDQDVVWSDGYFVRWPQKP